jgi:hypothetical protein
MSQKLWPPALVHAAVSNKTIAQRINAPRRPAVAYRPRPVLLRWGAVSLVMSMSLDLLQPVFDLCDQILYGVGRSLVADKTAGIPKPLDMAFEPNRLGLTP